MGKDFLKLTHNTKHLSRLVFVIGTVITIGLGIKSVRDANIQTDYEITRPQAGEGVFEEELIAILGNETKVPIKVVVEETKLSEGKAEEKLLEAEQLLDKLILGENESNEIIYYDLVFPENILGTLVEIDWILKPLEYVESDGTIRNDINISEEITQTAAAILSCQGYTRDYEIELTFLPRTMSLEHEVDQLVQQALFESKEQEILRLPNNYKGTLLQWKKPLDVTFVYFFLFTLCATIFLHIGAKRDYQQEKKDRRKHLENEYPQIVSKFAMLLSAGLSVRNAWIRIVAMNDGKNGVNSPAYEEMKWAIRQMQKGNSELDVYENFGRRVGLVHYKKLMALFISDKRRGSRNLLEAMNEEMMQAWEEKRRKAKQQGEQVGTKLLIPMMGMLMVVFVIIIVPAFLSFGL